MTEKSEEMEKLLIRSALTFTNAASEVVGPVLRGVPSYWGRRICEAMLLAIDENIEPSLVVIRDTLGHEWRDAFDWTEIQRCASEVLIPSHWPGYLSRWRHRRQVEIGRQAAKLSAEALTDPSEAWRALDEASRLLLSVRRTSASGVSVVMSQTLSFIERERRQTVFSGISVLDCYLEDLAQGQVAIFGARPSVGKTVLAVNIALATAQKGTPVIYVSLEESTEMVGLRMLATHSEVGATKIRKQQMSDEEWRSVMASAETISRLPLRMATGGNLSAADVVEHIYVLKEETGAVPVLVLDYIQILSALDVADSDYQTVTKSITMLRIAAKETGCSLVVMAQLNRSGADTVRPTIRELKSSGKLEEDAGQIYLLSRDVTAGESEIHVGVCKNRYGPTGEVVISVDLPSGRLYTSISEARGEPLIDEGGFLSFV